MMILILGAIALLLGYLFYSKLIERTIRPFREPTPAVSRDDGRDYTPMPRWKNHLIQLLNIAGTGPIFGALMGAKWGSIVFLWIVFGTILGGAVHDYMSGMMSVRNDGSSFTAIAHKYLGKWARYPLLVLLVFLLIMWSATFARCAADLLVDITGLPLMFWMALILAYFIASALIPINKLIGRIYPVFGVLLIVMAVVVIAGLVIGGYGFPSMTLENLHPNGDTYFPDMLITVACGAISGFHATQSPMIARCLKDERDGRRVFYGAMVIESVIALVWATAGLAFYSGTAGLATELSRIGASGVVYDISTGVAGSIGGVLAVLGVIVCPITSGDTALRSARLMVQDDREVDPSDTKFTLMITLAIAAIIVLLCFIDFTVLWNYTSWLNQTLAAIVLWTATVFLLRTVSNRAYSLVTALPAMFMTMVVSSFIMHSGQGFGLDYNTAIIIGAVVTAVSVVAYARTVLGTSRPTVPSSEN
ncbi:Carbon starvation protein, predicted membrane protein [Thermoplasmatales archaeon BRNA1]|nr:Carbon starvation protein, predicted membrane protein [Thermoplasmatales archaeon BRNA1]